ncbi:MAG: hypothetical protein IPO13_08140 [Rhodocyclaceae bacterium]|nr:hypothetical protein [Rhodocyclaceae bacterium]
MRENSIQTRENVLVTATSAFFVDLLYLTNGRTHRQHQRAFPAHTQQRVGLT